MKVIIHLYADRAREGRIDVIDPDASAVLLSQRCLGHSDHSAATAAGNPALDPIHTLGNLPTGSFRASVVAAPVDPLPTTVRSYGAGIRYLLDPIAGQALDAKNNGRDGIEIHGGATGAPMPDNALRPTHGCCRVDDATITLMAQFLPNSFLVEVREDLT